jgi:hypothetical protein
MAQVITTGPSYGRLADEFRLLFDRSKPGAFGLAIAFVSLDGIAQLSALTASCNADCRLLAGVDGAVTHPKAIEAAADLGWSVRLGGGTPPGIFHPKLLVGAKRIDGNGRVVRPLCFYVGSGNLTLGGFNRNLECGVLGTDDPPLGAAANAFTAYWNAGKQLTAAELQSYRERFARENRRRRAADLELLGISAASPAAQTPPEPIIPVECAAMAWAGLQSFTGDYTFQVEFPKAAGKVLRTLAARHGSGTLIKLLCADGESREMQYKFYEDNSMFRLNVHNAVPGVQWARKNKTGVLAIYEDDGGRLHAEIIQPGDRLEEIVDRSAALGTLKSTTTRQYGWF